MLGLWRSQRTADGLPIARRRWGWHDVVGEPLLVQDLASRTVAAVVRTFGGQPLSTRFCSRDTADGLHLIRAFNGLRRLRSPIFRGLRSSRPSRRSPPPFSSPSK
eukprot:4881924-Pyramimonas_sp.AAC.1